MKLKFLFLSLFAFALTFTACSDDDEPQEPTTNTIVDIALADSQFSTLVAALERTNLVATLQGAGPFTVFAPTNAAFTALGVDLSTISDQDLTNILLYHVIGGKAIESSDLANGQSYESTASTSGPGNTPLSILIEKGSGVKVNNIADVVAADVIADNGVIHVVNNVITPLDIVGHALANSNFSTLVGALSGAPGDLVSVLQGTGPFTVFAPNNAAFAEIADVVASLSGEQLASVLTYHVVSGNVLSTALENNMSVPTVNGQSVTVDLSNGASLTDAGGNSSNIILTDVQATNGVIHVIEKVIIPSL
jgi:uncharacterized surface protein with fasciclin (FAS1) repeats